MMSMPGFNAEAAIYKSRQFYEMVGGFDLPASSVQPALGSSCWRACQGDPDCIECCLCVHRGGHPRECCF